MTIRPEFSEDNMYRARRDAVKASLTLALMLLIWALPSGAFAQTAEKTLHVGILSSGILENRDSLDQVFVQGLRDQGYVEGKNLTIERRYSSSKLKDNANELAGMKLDAILTTCTPSTRIMKEATSSTPIVMAAVSDPVRQGIIASLAKPGQNVTGTSSQAEDLLPKRLELLAALLPKSTTIAVLANANNPVHALGWQRLESAAQEMNLKLLKVELKKSDELAAAIDGAARAQVGALFVLPDDPMMYNLRPQIVELAAKNRMPDFYWASQFVESGGLMSYGESLRGSYRGAAAYVDKIKKGANPANLPVEQPTRFELVINMKTAKALGLTVPQSLLLRADEVIQ
jgi:putative tryptophan/tyrosine transport system substrate-binding protein